MEEWECGNFGEPTIPQRRLENSGAWNAFKATIGNLTAWNRWTSIIQQIPAARSLSVYQTTDPQTKASIRNGRARSPPKALVEWLRRMDILICFLDPRASSRPIPAETPRIWVERRGGSGMKEGSLRTRRTETQNKSIHSQLGPISDTKADGCFSFRLRPNWFDPSVQYILLRSILRKHSIHI